MLQHNQLAALVLGLSLSAGLLGLGAILGYSAIQHKEFERTVTVKGLSEREYPADIVIWTIEFTLANESLAQLHGAMETSVDSLRAFLESAGIAATQISSSAPVINDSYTNQYRPVDNDTLRYTGNRSLTVYSNDVPLIRQIMPAFATALRDGIIQIEGSWWSRAQYLFDSLNDVKPAMIEEATRNAREVAIKFAEDSGSTLGRIKYANQGQFSISDRDSTNQHLKRVRVVSTVEYYLAD